MHTVTSALICVVISTVVSRHTVFTCECESLIEVTNYCPNNGVIEWKCRAQCKKCAEGKIYHCAKRYVSTKIPDYEYGRESFTDGCAIEKKCKQGEEPVLTFIVNQKKVKDPEVYCEKCYNKNKYNPKVQRNSSTYSQCDFTRENRCTKANHKIACSDPGSSSDRSCRCDARRGYMPESGENGKMCSTENWSCIFKDCSAADEQMLLNYTCASSCPEGTNRSEESDDCAPVRTRKTNPTTDFKISKTTPKQIITTSETRISPTTTKQIVRSTEPSVTNNTGLIVRITVGIIVSAMVLAICCKYKLLIYCCRKCQSTLSNCSTGSNITNNCTTNYLGTVNYINAENVSFQRATTYEGHERNDDSQDDGDVNETTSLYQNADEPGSTESQRSQGETPQGSANPLPINSGVGGSDSQQTNRDKGGRGKAPIAKIEELSSFDEEINEYTEKAVTIELMSKTT